MIFAVKCGAKLLRRLFYFIGHYWTLLNKKLRTVYPRQKSYSRSCKKNKLEKSRKILIGILTFFLLNLWPLRSYIFLVSKSSKNLTLIFLVNYLLFVPCVTWKSERRTAVRGGSWRVATVRKLDNMYFFIIDRCFQYIPKRNAIEIWL